MINQPKKNILLTFDYELFLGDKSGTVENCLIKPTNLLLEILSKNNAIAIFFIDTTYIYRLEEISKSNTNALNDLNKINTQLINIVKLGHYIFHHIHPHWLDAKYLKSINQWSLENTDRFTFISINEKEKDNLFKFSNQFLNNIYIQAKSDIKCEGFRAGGLFIEPFKSFEPFFEKYDIRYEFSVLPGEKMIGDILFYDFSNCPSKNFYSFEKSLSIEKMNGKYIEFPISRIKIAGYTKFLNSVYYRFHKNKTQNKPFGDGLAVNSIINNSSTKKRLKDYWAFNLAISIELLNPTLLSSYKNLVNKNKFVHFLSHPKLLSITSLDNLNSFLIYCNKYFNIEYDFKKMKMN